MAAPPENIVSIRNDVVLFLLRRPRYRTTNRVSQSQPRDVRPDSSSSNISDITISVYNVESLSPSLLASQSLELFYANIERTINENLLAPSARVVSFVVGKLQLILSSATQAIPWEVVEFVTALLQLLTRLGNPAFWTLVLDCTVATVQFVITVDLFLIGMNHLHLNPDLDPHGWPLQNVIG